MPVTKDELIARIEQAFPNTVYAGSNASCTCEECQELHDAIRQKPRMDFDPIEVRSQSAGFSLFSDDAYDHFLPAYICGFLIDREAVDVVWDYLGKDFLVGPSRALRSLSDEQRAVIEEFVEWFKAM